MSLTLEEQFEAIITKALSEAARVPCAQEVYLVGLELMKEYLDDTVDTVRAEVKRKRRQGA